MKYRRPSLGGTFPDHFGRYRRRHRLRRERSPVGAGHWAEDGRRLAVQREVALHQEEQHERHRQRHRDPHVVFHHTRTLVHLAGAGTPLTGVEFSIKSLRFVTGAFGEVISPGSRGVDADRCRFSRRDPHRRIFIQSNHPSAGSRARPRHSATFRRHPLGPRSGSTVAKAVIRRSKAERKQTEAHRRSHHDRRHRIRRRRTRRRRLPEPDSLKRPPCTETNSSPDTPRS